MRQRTRTQSAFGSRTDSSSPPGSVRTRNIWYRRGRVVLKNAVYVARPSDARTLKRVRTQRRRPRPQQPPRQQQQQQRQQRQQQQQSQASAPCPVINRDLIPAVKKSPRIEYVYPDSAGRESRTEQSGHTEHRCTCSSCCVHRALPASTDIWTASRGESAAPSARTTVEWLKRISIQHHNSWHSTVQRDKRTLHLFPSCL